MVYQAINYIYKVIVGYRPGISVVAGDRSHYNEVSGEG